MSSTIFGGKGNIRAISLARDIFIGPTILNNTHKIYLPSVFPSLSVMYDLKCSNAFTSAGVISFE